MKICTGGKIHCNEEKSLSEFYDGRNQCKDCKKQQQRQPKEPKEILLEGYKRCNGKCKEVKTIDKFYKNKNGEIRNMCIICHTEYNKKYYIPIKIKENLSKGFKRCKGGIMSCGKIKLLSEFNEDKKMEDGYLNQCKECLNEYQRQYRINNKETLKKYRRSYNERKKKLQKDKYNNNLEFKFLCSMRRMLSKTFNLINSKKQKRTIEQLGYSPVQLMQRLEMNFTKDMNWNNYGIYWEIDHIIPLSEGLKMFKDVGIYDKNEMAKIINALSNLQPLTFKQNRSKGNKIIFKK